MSGLCTLEREGVYRYLCLRLYLSLYLSIHASAYPSIYLFLSLHQPVGR